ncbi:MgtC/SapB family protein [Catenulispora rubra]|uniref:MgtC/SapB family protein n=1 Tax=Catenulispora rubra TaxID=280293 RepID=UPI0018921A48|nr:MgtC/SapB family protein [Catenulispora rubra]
MHLHLDSLSQLGRLSLAFVLTYLLGFERDLRGSPAGDRTFSLIGVGSAIIAVLAKDGNAPNALAGVITGVGFIGAGVVFRPNLTMSARWHLIDTVKGVTTAATIFAAAAIGAACGFGRLILGTGGTALVLLALEVRHIPILKFADGRRWASRFANDEVAVDPLQGQGHGQGKDSPES